MGKDNKLDRKASKTSSSARAAEILTTKSPGFGGFMGNSPMGPNVPGFRFGGAAAARITAPTAAVRGATAAVSACETGSSSAGGDFSGTDVPLTGQVNGDLAQCLRHLSKKDPMTKNKALQNLRSLIPGSSTADLSAALPPWIYMYRRLILDPSRAVRSETATTLAALLPALGKALAPQLRGLMGPWFLAMHDPCADAAAATRSAFSAAFASPRRQLDAVLFCRTELMAYLRDQLAATPQQLGDPRKDSPEEMEDRHERVQSACLAALAGLIELVAAPPPPPPPAEEGSEAPSAAPSPSAAATATGPAELLAAVHDVVCRPGFWRAAAGAKSAAIRRSAYGLARCAALRAPGALLADCSAEAAVSVLGALGEKEPANHGAMWEAVLTYGKFCPDGWRHVNLRKMLLPRLYALLRHGCFGSAATSLPALLPLLALLPPGTLGPAPDMLVAVLEALWTGLQDPACGSRPAKAACLSAYSECLTWGLISSARLVVASSSPPPPGQAAAGGGTAGVGASGGDATAMAASAAYCRALLQGTLERHVLPEAVRAGAQGEAAADLVADLIQAVAAAGNKAAAAAGPSLLSPPPAATAAAIAVPLGCLTDSIGAAVRETLARSVRTEAAARSDGGSNDTGDAGNGLAAACDGVAAFLSRVRGRSTPAAGLPTNSPLATAAATFAATAVQGLTTGTLAGLPPAPAASQLLASLLREYGTGVLAGGTPAGGAIAAAAGASVGAAKDVHGAGAIAAAASDADAGDPAVSDAPSSSPVLGADLHGAGSSFSLDALVASYVAGPVTGTAAEASADLLLAFCLSHSAPSDHVSSMNEGTGSAIASCAPSSALWEQVVAAVLRPPSATAGPAGRADSDRDQVSGVPPPAAAALQRTTLLLRRYAASAQAAGDPRRLPPSQPPAWTCPALDAAALALAEARGASALPARDQTSAGFLSTALGGNEAGYVLLGRDAAAGVVEALTYHLTAAAEAADATGGSGVDAAAELALAVLREPLHPAAGCDLWRLLPEETCRAVAAVVRLSWRAPCATPYAVWARRWLPGVSYPDLENKGDGGDNSEDGGASSSGGEEAEDGEEDGEGLQKVRGGAGEPSEEEEGEDWAAGEEEDGGVAITAGQFLHEVRPLAAAAGALPAARMDELLSSLAGKLALMTAAAPLTAAGALSSGKPGGFGGGVLSPRSWAAHAAALLDAVPEGPVLLTSSSPGPGCCCSRQGVLHVLLSAVRAEWRDWSGGAGATDGGAGARTSAPVGLSGEGPAGHQQPAPSLEYLARLVEAAGPRQVLGLGQPVAEALLARGGGCSARWWLPVELLCSHYAAASRIPTNDEEEDEDKGSEGEDYVKEESDEIGLGRQEQQRRRARGSWGGSGSVLSAPWRRAVARASEALLRHVVYGALDEAAAGEDCGGSGGLYGSLLRKVADELAEGCRGPSVAGAEDILEPLPPRQAASLDALCHTFSLVDRAAAQAVQAATTEEPYPPSSSPTSLSPSRPPLLSHQQRLCRHWLSTSPPDVANRSGLPPQALLRLLPLAAGPVRRAAAAAAAAAGSGAGEAILAASGLPELSCNWVRHCLGRPAVLVEPSPTAVGAVAVAVACFPVPTARGGSSASGSGAAALAQSGGGCGGGGAGLAPSERPLLMQLVRHQLVRHAGVAAARRQQGDSQPSPTVAAASGPAATAATTTTAAAAPWPLQSEAARAVVTRLSHAAVVYDWRGLGQPEWHALLQDAQDHLAAAVAALLSSLRQLAATARDAADGVLRQPAGSTPPGPMALQMLRKLGERGVLARVPQGAQLAGRSEEVLTAWGAGEAAEAAAQLAAVLVDLLDEVPASVATASGAAAAAREHGSAISSCCSLVMQLVIGLGAVETHGSAFGPAAAAAVDAWLGRNRGFWAAVSRCAGRVLAPGLEHLGEQAAASAVAETAGALAAAGLDAAGALLQVALTRGSQSHVLAQLQLQPVAYRLLLGGGLLRRITLEEAAAGMAAAAGGGGGDDGGEVELPEYGGDDVVSYLTAAGIRPEMAQWLVLPAAAAADAPRVYLTAWSLLLAHTLELDAGCRALAALRQLLREVGHLVHALLGLLVAEMGLRQRQGGLGQERGRGHHHHHHHHGRKGGQTPGRHGGSVGEPHGGSAAAGADGWRLAEALREIGLPAGRHAARATCRVLYRAVLRALPATARGWFGDLRDRGLAAAVESYTAVAEGPALLAAEMASVQGLSRRGGDADGGRFTVHASAGGREVVAVLEVEDGAVLELVVRLPACLPLRAPEVECRRKVGVNDTRLRKWLLSIATFLRHQNGSVADAIGLWKRNVDSEFAGVEACLICYSVISSVNAQLPRLVCRTCNVRFHPACLYKWFKSAGKSQCPHCQALW